MEYIVVIPVWNSHKEILTEINLIRPQGAGKSPSQNTFLDDWIFMEYYGKGGQVSKSWLWKLQEEDLFVNLEVLRQYFPLQ